LLSVLARKATSDSWQVLTGRLVLAYSPAIRLFDELDRSDCSPASNAEHSFEFLNRVGGAFWERLRGTLETWFADYPAAHAAELRGRFRSERAGGHLSAWWELYLHRLFTRLGYQLEVHPELPDSPNRPDFLLVGERERIYLEAGIVFSGIVPDERRHPVREGWILDALNRHYDPNFMLHVESDRVGSLRPRDRDVYGPVADWLGSLDPDAVSAEYDRSGKLPERRVSVGEWELRYRAIPVKPEARGLSRRLVGIGPITTGRVDDMEQLRDTLKQKRGRYGNPEIPLVVAVSLAAGFDDEDIEGTLYGSRAVQFRVDQPGWSREVRQMDGTWITERGPRGERLSAVLTAAGLAMTNVLNVRPQLWLNPSARVALKVDWPFAKWSCTDAGLVSMEPAEPEMAELLGLPDDWPGPEPAFPPRTRHAEP
jgi:hypothetical protein